MTKYYHLNVSYPLPANSKEIEKEDAKIEKIVGRESSDSGAGFGQRDIGWVFEFKTAADVTAEKLRAERYDVTVIEHDHD